MIPLEAAAGRERHAHDVPPAGHGVAEGVEAALGLDERWSVVANTTPDVPRVSEMTPGRTMPLPTAPAAWSPPPATTGVPAAQARLGRGRGG